MLRSKSIMLNFTSKKRLVIFLALIGLTPACSKDGDSGLDISVANDRIGKIMEQNENTPGWPPFPRRLLHLSDTLKNDTFLSVGTEGSFFDIFKASAKGGLTIGVKRQTSLLLVKHSNKGDHDLTEKVNGEVLLKHEPGVEYVALCDYKLALDLGSRFLGSVTVMGNGIENTTELTRSTDVTQTSTFWTVKQGDTISYSLAKCDRAFNRYIKNRVAADFGNLTAGAIAAKYNAKSDYQYAMEAALFGPPQSRLFVLGHHWDIHPVSYESLAGNRDLFRISGWLTYNHKVSRNYDILFSFVFENGKVIEEKIATLENRDWTNASKELARAIANEAHSEFSPKISDVLLGDRLYAEFFTDQNFQGSSFKLSIGRYDVKTLEGFYGFKNDSLTSARVPKGLKVRMYDRGDFVGAYRNSGHGEAAHLGEWNDRVSSIVVEADREEPPYHIYKTSGDLKLGIDGSGLPVLSKEREELWTIELVNYGYFRIKSGSRSKYLAMDAQAKLFLADGSSHDSEQWMFVRNQANHACYVIINKSNGKAVSQAAARGDDQAELSFCFGNNYGSIPEPDTEFLSISP